MKMVKSWKVIFRDRRRICIRLSRSSDCHQIVSYKRNALKKWYGTINSAYHMLSVGWYRVLSKACSEEFRSGPGELYFDKKKKKLLRTIQKV